MVQVLVVLAVGKRGLEGGDNELRICGVVAVVMGEAAVLALGLISLRSHITNGLYLSVLSCTDALLR
jgi:hypothetical protein